MRDCKNVDKAFNQTKILAIKTLFYVSQPVTLDHNATALG